MAINWVDKGKPNCAGTPILNRAMFGGVAHIHVTCPDCSLDYTAPAMN